MTQNGQLLIKAAHSQNAFSSVLFQVMELWPMACEQKTNVNLFHAIFHSLPSLLVEPYTLMKGRMTKQKELPERGVGRKLNFFLTQVTANMNTVLSSRKIFLQQVFRPFNFSFPSGGWQSGETHTKIHTHSFYTLMPCVLLDLIIFLDLTKVFIILCMMTRFFLLSAFG